MMGPPAAADGLAKSGFMSTTGAADGSLPGPSFELYTILQSMTIFF